jgi:putative OPT family oligopeptide transporter
MNEKNISGQERTSEISFRVIVLTVVLALILAVANTYLALKIGTVTSASIPAAILSMGILRFFKNTTILEHNLIQTGASAGEAVAGGIVFTIPALVILNYWHGFPYFFNFFIALLSSFSGIFLSIPLRKYLMNDSTLRFPEGRAVAEVLKTGDQQGKGFRDLIVGAGLAAFLEFLQSSKILASSVTIYKTIGGLVTGASVGFSVILMGAGYLMGWDVALSMIIGSLFTWTLGLLFLSGYDHSAIVSLSATQAFSNVLNNHLREIGVSAMLLTGFITLLNLVKPVFTGLNQAIKQAKKQEKSTKILLTERDFPFSVVFYGLLICFIGMGILLFNFVPPHILHFSGLNTPELFALLVIYLLILGFILSATAGYFSGLVGVTVSPGSAFVIAAMLLSAVLVKFLMSNQLGGPNLLLETTGAGITILLGALLTGMACIANDNMQDLKVGQLVGSTPWKQQLMLLLGALIASAVVPLVMQLLFQTYGIGGVVPRAGMNLTETLPAPPAAVMAMLAKGVFQGGLDWPYFLMGIGWVAILCVIKLIFKQYNITLSLLAMAIGVYLPMATASALFIGGFIAWAGARDKNLSASHIIHQRQKGYLIACGVVIGAILTDVLWAIVAAFSSSANAYEIHSSLWVLPSYILGILAIVIFIRWWLRNLKWSG